MEDNEYASWTKEEIEREIVRTHREMLREWLHFRPQYERDLTKLRAALKGK